MYTTDNHSMALRRLSDKKLLHLTGGTNDNFNLQQKKKNVYDCKNDAMTSEQLYL